MKKCHILFNGRNLYLMDEVYLDLMGKKISEGVSECVI